MPYKLRSCVRHKIPKRKYRITNWHSYEQGLRNRGNISFWFSDDAVKSWYCKHTSKTVGRQLKYSDVAIKTGLILKVVFGLTYRSLEGFLESLCKMTKLKLDIPDHTLFSRRASKIRGLEISKLNVHKSVNVMYAPNNTT